MKMFFIYRCFAINFNLTSIYRNMLYLGQLEGLPIVQLLPGKIITFSFCIKYYFANISFNFKYIIEVYFTKF